MFSDLTNFSRDKLLLRLFGPGAIRFMLAAFVMISHVTSLSIGRISVLVFFFLSGYWVSRLWAEDKHFGRFVTGRLLRVMPLYWLVLFGAAYLKHNDILLHNIVLLGTTELRDDPIHVAWSLEMELEFYLVLPLLAMLRSSILVAVSFVISAAAIVLAPYITVANFLPAFALGALVFKNDIRPSGKAAIWSVAGFIALTCIFLATPFSYFIFNRPMDEYMDIDMFSFVWMLPILPFVAWSLRMRSDPLDRHLGNISYPLYLIHFTVFTLVGTGDPVAKIKAALMAILLATIIYIVIEQPLEHWRHWVVQRMRRHIPAAG